MTQETIQAKEIEDITYISRREATQLVANNHYSVVMPKINKVYVGAWHNGKIVGVCTFGYGVRPFHTINKLFPSLGTKDYFEIGKLCMPNFMAKNSESYFISKAVKLIKKDFPHIKVIFSWADGIMGKPGYVYQGSNFFYGGFIWTHCYLSPNNIRVHVRTMQGLNSQEGEKFGSVNWEKVKQQGYSILYGKQFRYILPTCNKREWKNLLKESPFLWKREDYPKDKDCQFYIKDRHGKREIDMPDFQRTTHIQKNETGQKQLF